MSKHFLHSMLTVLVLTLAASNVILATSMGELQKDVPALAAQLDTVSTQLHAAIIAKQTAPTITSLSPTFGPIGTLVTITGTGFLPSNTVKVVFGYHRIEDIPSKDLKTLQFTVPSQLIYPCLLNQPCPTSTVAPTIPGNYPIMVFNAKGASNTLVFTVK